MMLDIKTVSKHCETFIENQQLVFSNFCPISDIQNAKIRPGECPAPGTSPSVAWPDVIPTVSTQKIPRTPGVSKKKKMRILMFCNIQKVDDI